MSLSSKKAGRLEAAGPGGSTTAQAEGGKSLEKGMSLEEEKS
jgi:hypothetical protein